MWKRYITDLCATVKVSMKVTALFQTESTFQSLSSVSTIRTYESITEEKTISYRFIIDAAMKVKVDVFRRGEYKGYTKLRRHISTVCSAFLTSSGHDRCRNNTTRGLVARAIQTRSLPNRVRERFGRAHAHAQYVRSAFARATQLSRRVHARTRARTHLPVVPAIA